MTLPAVLGEDASELENEAVEEVNALAECEDEGDPQEVAEPTEEAVPGAAVALTALEALAGEAEGECVEDCDGEDTVEAVAQVL